MSVAQRGQDTGRDTMYLWGRVESVIDEMVDEETRKRYTPLAWLFLRTKKRKGLSFNDIREAIPDRYPNARLMSKEVLWRAMAPKDDPLWSPITLETAYQIAAGLEIPLTKAEIEEFYLPEHVEQQRHILRKQVERAVGEMPSDVKDVCGMVNMLQPWQLREIRAKIEGWLGL